MSEEKLRQQLYESFATRAHINQLLLNQLRSELGEQKATDLMGRAIHQRGVQNAGKYASFAPRDLEGLRQAFVSNLPDEGAMFDPEVVRVRCRRPGHQVPPLPIEASLAGRRPPGKRGSHAVPDRRPG